jgi:UDP-2-acetamido-3-amino-2,3-dideoxy-glucuronate N-acetyltransferase
MIHKSADVQTKKVGDGTYIWQNVVVLEGAVIGENCNINCNCFIENEVVIGDNVTIKFGVAVWDNITIENNVFVGPNVTFTNDLVPKSKVYPSSFLKTVISENASLGANSTLIGGIEVGEFSLVGAGSLVSKSIPPFQVWYGNPAKHKGYITREGVTVGLDLKDQDGNSYLLNDKEPIKID